jgi:hypothetical protein
MADLIMQEKQLMKSRGSILKHLAGGKKKKIQINE